VVFQTFRAQLFYELAWNKHAPQVVYLLTPHRSPGDHPPCLNSCLPRPLSWPSPASLPPLILLLLMAKLKPTVTDEKLDEDAVSKVYGGQEIKVCCKKCFKDFEKDQAKYLKKLEAGHEHKGGKDADHKHEK
jgi:hypothetical protein